MLAGDHASHGRSPGADSRLHERNSSCAHGDVDPFGWLPAPNERAGRNIEVLALPERGLPVPDNLGVSASIVLRRGKLLATYATAQDRTRQYAKTLRSRRARTGRYSVSSHLVGEEVRRQGRATSRWSAVTAVMSSLADSPDVRNAAPAR